ncbi:hypothetical protein G6O69_36290 [Pseudenhygromyxa sp. WMMC2535]|uniref:leucine-rich repeat domain-containing protein n=1 Tax=Pseudenhygromyxa sp. WMMC2535 TaxID=2712867 RepID=UPI001555C132|nr:hypothetical protein [Pseudenhygromyxa sp. WMMC2535]NVB43342.1 hypothetical protein [Pseudenhygromyxa sp. WMMC2535]
MEPRRPLVLALTLAGFACRSPSSTDETAGGTADSTGEASGADDGSTDTSGAGTNDTDEGSASESVDDTGEQATCSPASFPDPQLDALVREALALGPDAALGPETLAQLESLSIPSQSGVESIAGLECATGLSFLSLSLLPESLEPLADLPALETLQLRGDLTFSDPALLAPLASLPALDFLWIESQAGLALGGLEGASAPVTRLRLSADQVSGSQALASFTQVSELKLQGLGFDDLDFIAGMPALADISLIGTEVADISALAQANALERFESSSSPVVDLSPLAAKGLHTLTCSGSQLEDISALATMPALAHVELSFNAVTDLGPLAELPALTSLVLSHSLVSDLSPLSSVPTLDELRVESTPLGPLPEGIAASKLYLFACGIEDIAALVTWGPPDSWDLSNNEIEDLSPLLAAPWVFEDEACHLLDVSSNPLSAPGNADTVAQLCAQGLSVFNQDEALACEGAACLPSPG